MKTSKQLDRKTVIEKLAEHLKEQLPNNDADPNAVAELPAAISHWLWNQDARLPFFSDEMAKAAVSYLKAEFPEAIDRAGRVNPGALGLKSVNFPPKPTTEFRFIDLFAGIGGFRIAMQQNRGKCVFTSEWDRFAKQTYNDNFGEIPYGDIDQIDPESIPDHDVLCAGFPCQPFSLAGVSKNASLGRKHGFEHATQGTLFFNICKILDAKRPKAFFLENVKNLKSHNGGDTFNKIMSALVDDLGYVVNYRVVEGGNWVPQHRERIFIVGYDPDQIQIEDEDDIIIPAKPKSGYPVPSLKEILNEPADGRYTLGVGTWDTLERHKLNHADAGNGFGYGLIKTINDDTRTRTISARYHKDGAEILIDQPGKRPRRLTPKEAKQLQGYDRDKFEFTVSDTQAYRQIGNSVVVPAIEATAKEIAKVLRRNS